MPKRISPKFCARGRSQIQKLSYVVPNPSAKLGLNEPWPECQPELFQNDAAAAAAPPPTTREQHIHPGRCPESITYRDQISYPVQVSLTLIYIYIYI